MGRDRTFFYEIEDSERREVQLLLQEEVGILVFVFSRGTFNLW
jgi:hypothetical protein